MAGIPSLLLDVVTAGLGPNPLCIGALRVAIDAALAQVRRPRTGGDLATIAKKA